jgi:hypothetical protein
MSELEERIEALTGSNPYHLVERVRVAGQAFQEQEAEVSYLKEMRKVVLAEQMTNVRVQKAKEEIKITTQEVDALARTSYSYTQHLTAIKDAEKELAELQTRYYALRNLLDLNVEGMKLLRSEAYLTPRE